jgi:peptidase E
LAVARPYRGREAPGAIKINHHKTGGIVWHPLEEATEEGVIKFYADAEAVLTALPRHGVAMILKQRQDGTTEPYTAMQMARSSAYSVTVLACRQPLRSTPADMAA